MAVDLRQVQKSRTVRPAHEAIVRSSDAVRIPVSLHHESALCVATLEASPTENVDS